MSQFFSQGSHLISQQPERSSAIVVPLVKFSCSLSNQNDTTSAKWSHYSRNDLELVIQEVHLNGPQGQNESHLVMKVVAGAEYLEEQNLEDIARIHKNFIPSPGLEIPVRVVVKPPLLALRYPKLHDVRRLQFRFRNDSDFNQIVNILTNLGLPAMDSASSGPALQARPSTASSISSGTTIVPSTPTTTYLSSSQNTEFKVPMRPDSVSSVLQRPSSSYTSRSDEPPFSRPQSAMSISSYMPQSKPSAEQSKRAESLYVSQLERGSPEVQSSNFEIPSSNSMLTGHNTYGNRALLPRSEELQRRFSASPFFESRVRDCLPNGIVSPLVNDRDNNGRNEQSTILDSVNASEIHPRSSPTEYSLLSALRTRPISLPNEHDICFGLPIPPKRQLPFATGKAPSKSRSASVADTDRPIQAQGQRKRSIEEFFNANPTSKIPTPTKKPTKRRIASRKSTHLPCKIDPPTKGTISKSDGLGPPPLTEEPSLIAAKTVVAPSTLRLPSKLQPKGAGTQERPVSNSVNNTITPKMVDRSTQTQTLSGRDHTAALKPAPIAPVIELPSNLPTAFEPPPILQKDLDLFVSRFSSRSRIDLPPNYTDVPDNARHKMLNDFIIANLENEDFLKLAEDMDASWRRMGLSR